jgi:protoheme IX farnesyltransferase
MMDLWDLAKPEITFLVAISSLAGFFLASTSGVDVALLMHALVGVTLSAAGGGMLNHYIERDLDAKMRRTSTRPLPAGRIPPPVALGVGITFCLLGIVQLVVNVNLLTALLGAVTVVGYLCVYTPLKTRTKYNTIIGCVPGALPALGGWTAATGSIDAGGLVLFAILFVWQMPHFLSLAWMYRRDYARAGFAMLPVEEPDGRSTGLQTLLFTVLVVAFSIAPWIMDLAGTTYLVGIIVAGAFFLHASYRFQRSLANSAARKVLLASVVYVPILVALVLVDQLVA